MKPFALALVLVASAATADVLQFPDRFRMVNVSSPQIAPDGRSIAAVVSRANTKENRFDTELVLVDVASGAQRSLTFERRGITQPRWSPDGSSVAFLAITGSAEPPRRQVWVAPMNGGDARPVTDAPGGVQQYAWSPDGARIAFVTADEAPQAEDELAKHNKAFEVREDDFLVRQQVRPSHLWVVPAAGGPARRLTSGEWSVPMARPPGPLPSPINWSPDGKAIALTRLDDPHGGNSQTARIALLDVETGQLRRLTAATVAETQPLISPDGKWVAFTHPHEGAKQSENRIWIVPAAGGDGQRAHHHARPQHLPGVLDAGQRLPAGGRARPDQLRALDPAAGRVTRAAAGPRRRAAHGRLLDRRRRGAERGHRLRRRQAHQPARAVLHGERFRPSATPHALQHGHEGLELARAERITFPTKATTSTASSCTRRGSTPRRSTRWCSTSTAGRARPREGLLVPPQVLAAQGWIVFMPNYRGSDNLRQRVKRAILEDAGAGPGRDVMAGIEVVKKRGVRGRGRASPCPAGPTAAT